MDHLKNDLPYNDSLATHFAWLPMAANFDAVKSGYELWLSEGANIITNDSIRLQISFVYDQQYTWMRISQKTESTSTTNLCLRI